MLFRFFQIEHCCIPCQEIHRFCLTAIFFYLKLYNGLRCILRRVSAKHFYTALTSIRSAYIGLNTGWIKSIAFFQRIRNSITLHFIKQRIIIFTKIAQSNLSILTTWKHYFCTFYLAKLSVVYMQSLYLCSISGYAKGGTSTYQNLFSLIRTSGNCTGNISIVHLTSFSNINTVAVITIF